MRWNCSLILMWWELCFVISEIIPFLTICHVFLIGLMTILSQASLKSSCCVFSDYQCLLWCWFSIRDTLILDCSLEFFVLFIDLLIDIVNLWDVQSFVIVIWLLFLLSLHFVLVVFSWSWWCDCSGNLILYSETFFLMII